MENDNEGICITEILSSESLQEPRQMLPIPVLIKQRKSKHKQTQNKKCVDWKKPRELQEAKRIPLGQKALVPRGLRDKES